MVLVGIQRPEAEARLSSAPTRERQLLHGRTKWVRFAKIVKQCTTLLRSISTPHHRGLNDPSNISESNCCFPREVQTPTEITREHQSLQSA